MTQAKNSWSDTAESTDEVPLALLDRHLLVCQDVLGSPAVACGLKLFQNDFPFSATALTFTYLELWRLLSSEATSRGFQAPGDAWQQHLATRLLASEGTFARAARHQSPQAMSPTLLHAARHDLSLLSHLYHLGAEGLRRQCPHPDLMPDLPGDFAGDAPRAKDYALRQLLHQTPNWSTVLSSLIDHYRSIGTGILAHGIVFRWLGAEHTPPFKLIERYDPIRLADLIGDTQQRQMIIRNTLQFLAGLPANNVLLYGDRGTGKSSTIKALINEYADRGLRLIEVPRNQLKDFPQIVEILQDQPAKFILFVDDLSFEEAETSYKDLKAVLEGGVEVRPGNVVVYATSNRRHLIREYHSDRPQPGEGEVHAFDTFQEQLSLADRFGLTVTFLTPDQEQYLAIVRHMADQRQLPISPEELRIRALQWSAWHNGRSGRSARQFIDDLTGELVIGAISHHV